MVINGFIDGELECCRITSARSGHLYRLSYSQTRSSLESAATEQKKAEPEGEVRPCQGSYPLRTGHFLREEVRAEIVPTLSQRSAGCLTHVRDSRAAHMIDIYIKTSECSPKSRARKLAIICVRI